jgi:polar amino acid transport system substrate-binding protein
MRLLACLFLATGLVAADTVTLRADHYPPFNGDPKSDRPGLIIEVATAVFVKAGITVDYQVMPWTRTLDEVTAGRIDGAVGAEPDGTPDLVFPSEASAYWQPIFATPADSTWTYSGPDSLKGLAVGIVQDYDYGKDPQGNSYSGWFAANPQKVQTLKGDKPNEIATGLLSRKRIDLFIEDWSVIQASAAAAKVDPAAIRNAGTSGEGYPLFIGFSPTDRGRTLAKTLGEGIAAMRAEGSLAPILARYGVTDWKH